jgi:membrane protein required for colicin V production
VNAFDIVLLIIAAILVLFGVVKGLVRILIGMAALVAAFVLAAQFHRPLADSLSGLAINAELMRLIAYLLIFLGVMLAGGLLAFLTRKLVKAAMLSWADRLGGAAMGLVVAMLAAALIILPLVAYSPYSEKVLANSVLAPYVTVVADMANMIVPEELSEQYRRKVEDLRRFWRERLYGPAASESPSV